MTTACRLGLGFALLFMVAAAPRPARAIDATVTATARAMAEEGARDYLAGRYEDAARKLLKAYEAVKLPTLARSAARALEKQGKLVAASELFRQAIRLEPNELWRGQTQQNAQAEAAAELRALLLRVPRLVVVIAGAPPEEVMVSLDGKRVPPSLVGGKQQVDPGPHRIVGQHGTKVVQEEVTLEEADLERVVLTFEAKAAATPPRELGTAASNAARGRAAGGSVVEDNGTGQSQRLGGWIGLGIGAAGIVTGTTAGILVATQYTGLKKNCENDTCSPDQVKPGSVDTYNTLRLVSTAGFILGGIGAAAGATLLLTSPKPPQAEVALWVGPASAGLRGTF